MAKGDIAPSGWCMTGTHDECANFYLKQPYNRGCVCVCHLTSEERSAKLKETAVETDTEE
jgi:hypothetical protein